MAPTTKSAKESVTLPAPGGDFDLRGVADRELRRMRSACPRGLIDRGMRVRLRQFARRGHFDRSQVARDFVERCAGRHDCRAIGEDHVPERRRRHVEDGDAERLRHNPLLPPTALAANHVQMNGRWMPAKPVAG